MSNFKQTKIPISCAHCGHDLTIIVQQIIDEAVLDCSGCGKEIALRDENGWFRQAAKEMEGIAKSALN